MILLYNSCCCLCISLCTIFFKTLFITHLDSPFGTSCSCPSFWHAAARIWESFLWAFSQAGCTLGPKISLAWWELKDKYLHVLPARVELLWGMNHIDTASWCLQWDLAPSVHWGHLHQEPFTHSQTILASACPTPVLGYLKSTPK